MVHISPVLLLSALFLFPGPAALAWSEDSWFIVCERTYVTPESPAEAFFGGGPDCRYETHHAEITRPIEVTEAFREEVQEAMGLIGGWFDEEGWRRPDLRWGDLRITLHPGEDPTSLAAYLVTSEEIVVYMELFQEFQQAESEGDLDLEAGPAAGPISLVPGFSAQTLAHELFHAIQFAHLAFDAEANAQDSSRDVAGWITEGTAEAFGTLAVLHTVAEDRGMEREERVRRLWDSDWVDARFSDWPLTLRGFGGESYGTQPFWTHVYLDHFEGRSGDIGAFFDATGARDGLNGTDGGAAMDAFLRRQAGVGLTEVWLDFLLRTLDTPMIRDELRHLYYACDPLTALASGGTPWVHEDSGTPDNNLQVRCFDIEVPQAGEFRTFSINWDEAGDDPDGTHFVLADGRVLEPNTRWHLGPGEGMQLTVLQTLGDPEGYDANLQRDVPVTFRLERQEGCDPALGTVDLRLPGGGLERHAPRPDPDRGGETYYFPGGLAPIAEGPGVMTISGGTQDTGAVCAIIQGLSPTSEVTDEMVENATTMLLGEPGPDGHDPAMEALTQTLLGPSRPAPQSISMTLDAMHLGLESPGLLSHGGAGGWRPDANPTLSLSIDVAPDAFGPGTYGATVTNPNTAPYSRVVSGGYTSDRGFIGATESVTWDERTAPTGTVTIHRIEGDYAWGTLEIRAPGHHNQYSRRARRVCDPTCEVHDEVIEDSAPVGVTMTATFQAGLNP